MGKRGRTRTKKYRSIEEFLMDFEKEKRHYLAHREIVKTLLGHTWKKLEQADEGRHIRGGYKPIIKTKYHGDAFRCPQCGQLDHGKEFVLDLEHDPPRLRVTLSCGHRIDFRLDKEKIQSFSKEDFGE